MKTSQPVDFPRPTVWLKAGSAEYRGRSVIRSAQRRVAVLRWSSGFGRREPGLRPSCYGYFLLLAVLLCGCTSMREYVSNGFKVGPNYCPPKAPVEENWIDATDRRLRQDTDHLADWWTVFHDPALDSLICRAYHQNLTLREAAFRVLEARAQLAIATGELFPQTQTATGGYSRNAVSGQTANGQFTPTRFFDQWNYAFNLNWEIDFWGRLRRAIESQSATLDASVEDYDDTLVTLLGDVATNYVQLRVAEADRICEIQRRVAAADVDDHRGPSQRRHDARAGHVPGS